MRRAVTITVRKGQNFLGVTNRRYGGVTLPGGKVEDGETIEEAAIRELYEETGLTPNALKYIGTSLFRNPISCNPELCLVSHFRAIFDTEEKILPVQMEKGTIPSWLSADFFYTDSRSIFREHLKGIYELGVVK